MMDTELVLFLSLSLIIIICFFRILLINLQVRTYIKKYYPEFWEANIYLLSGGGKIGPNIFQLVKELKDPKIEVYMYKWKKSLWQLFVMVCVMILIIAGYIYCFKLNTS